MNKNFTVLIVDDDEDDRAVFCEVMLEVYPNARCITAKSGCDALNKLEAEANQKPAVIFLDINMPIMNGKQCLAALKASPATCDIPVVIYTTSKLVKDREETVALGAYDFLSKPAKSADIKNGIKKILAKIIREETISKLPALLSPHNITCT